jgi:glycosyltransferase involved in cell wall biosynthesis
MHDWQTLHRTWTESSCDGIEFRIHATGRGARLLAEACNESAIKAKVIFGLPLAESGWIAAMHDAPVCLVTLRRGAEYVVFPSKTFSSMLAGQAVLAIAPRESDLADLVIGHGCGWVVEPGDTRALLTVLLEIREQPALLVERRRKAREAALRHYCTEPLVAAWRMVLNDID